MVFESLISFFLEFVNSYVRVETALGIHFLEDLDLFAGLKVIVLGMMETNHLEVPGAPHVKIPVLGHEVTHGKTFPSSWTKTSIKQGVKFPCTSQPITWENRIVVAFIAMCPVSRKHIDHAVAILMSLREIKLVISVVIWMMLEK